MPRPHHTAPHGTTPSHALPRPPSPSLALPGGVVISNVIDPTLLSVMSIDDEIVALNDQELSAYGITGHESLAQALQKQPLRARPLKLTCKRAAVKPSGGRQAKPGTTAEEVPSTAVCIKNLDATVTEDELKAVLATFMNEGDQMLAACNFDRAIAFVDLGSTAAVAAVVTQSRREGGIQFSETKKLNVEPSKKPVRPSGIRAMHDRKGGGAPKEGGKGGGHGDRREGGGRGGGERTRA